jgi:hypothetical protein
MLPGQPLDLDHNDNGIGWRGWAHAHCNRSAGARLGNARRNRTRKGRTRRMLTTCTLGIMRVCHSVRVSRVVSGEVEIVPGIVGPERIVNEWPVDGRGGAVTARMDIRFDRGLSRYVCHELTVFRDPANPHSAPVTTELLREIPIEGEIAAALQSEALLAGYGGEVVEMRSRLTASRPAVTRELDNPGQVEPWGVHLPDEATEGGPTRRTLRWVAPTPTGWATHCPTAAPRPLRNC